MMETPIEKAVLKDPVVKAVLEDDRRSSSGQAIGSVAAPTTTEEENRVSAGQRGINLIWEQTQRQIAQWVIGSSLLVALLLAVFGKFLGTPDIQLAAVVFLFGVANLVTGFYFGRTNHQRTGGVGPIIGR